MKLRIIATAFLAAVVLTGCSLMGLSGSYSLSGASIPANASTFSVAYIPNNTPEFATLSNSLTEGLRDRLTRQTRLSQVPDSGDLSFEGEITSVTDAPTSISASTDGRNDGQAAQNRVTVTVRIRFTNTLQPELNVDQSFSAYYDYNTGSMRSTIESQLIEEVVTTLVDNIFNAALAQW